MITPVEDTITIVERPDMHPGQCIASMITEDSKGFIDTLLTPAVVDPRVYLSVSYVMDAARKLGMTMEPQADDRDERIAELEAQVEELERQLDAIDVMESAGFTARKRPGRKPAAKKTTKAKA